MLLYVYTCMHMYVHHGACTLYFVHVTVHAVYSGIWLYTCMYRHINIYTSIVLLGYMYKYNFSRKLRKISIIIEYRQGQYRDIRFSRYYRPKQIPDISDSVFPDFSRYLSIYRYFTIPISNTNES